jgi:hypothetical protein
MKEHWKQEDELLSCFGPFAIKGNMREERIRESNQGGSAENRKGQEEGWRIRGVSLEDWRQNGVLNWKQTKCSTVNRSLKMNYEVHRGFVL